MMTWNQIWNQICSLITELGLSGAAGAVAAFGMFKWLGASWLEAKFSRDLEQFKADKNKELEKLKSGYQIEAEHLKAEVGRLLDRSTKLHAREYDVLPTAWGLLNKAHGATSELFDRFETNTDVDSMSESEFQEFLNVTELSISEKEELKLAENKTACYRKLRIWLRLRRANKATIEYHNYIILNGLFIEDEVEKWLSEASNQLRLALIHRQNIEEGFRNKNSWRDGDANIKTAEELISKVKIFFRKKMLETTLPPSSHTG